MYFVYLIKCADGSIYTGITNNVEKRFSQHVSKDGARYTLQHGAEEVIHVEQYGSKSEAAKRERQIKGWRREKKINLAKFGRPL